MRTNYFKLVLVCVLITYPVISYSQRDIRIRENFDFDWKFFLNNSIDASSQTYDDLTWEKVQLPHDWSIRMPLNRRNGGSMGFLPGGIGWYRKTFNIPGNYKGKKIYIDFDGVYHQSDVYINGKHLGFHPYGYTGFEYELTPYLNFGGENTIAVKVDHSNSPSSRWYSGSGIYRHVWLKVTDPCHVSNWGTYITTPEVTNEVAGIKIVTTIENNTDKSEKIEVQNRIFDADGKEVASGKISTQIVEGKSGNADQLISLKQPNLWSVDNPYLYSMETIIRVKGKVVDSYKTPFGIRYFRFDADEGFFLNGNNIKLKGVNLHPDAGSLGTAVPDRSYLRRLRILKEYGCNAIRCSHNPPSPEFLDMCDSLGFVVIDEAFDKWKSGYYAKYFDDYWMKDLDAMLLRDRNHPSIVLWSTGNETTEQNDTTGAGTERAGMLQDYVRKAEPTRPVTIVISPSNVIQRPYHKNGFTEVFDIVGYNYVEPMLQEYRKNFPESIMYMAEAFPYYSGRKDYIRDYNPTNPWYTVANNDFVFGQFIWAGVDYLGETSGWPSTGWPTGLFDVWIMAI